MVCFLQQLSVDVERFDGQEENIFRDKAVGGGVVLGAGYANRNENRRYRCSCSLSLQSMQKERKEGREEGRKGRCGRGEAHFNWS
jgi:hypothetical protein